MIKAFSKNEWKKQNGKNIHDVYFNRNELYDIWTALNHYETKLIDDKKIHKAEEITSTINKIKFLINIDLKNE